MGTIKKSITELIKEHDRLTELKKLEVTERAAIMNTQNRKTSSVNQNPRHINPYTLTPEGHNPEQWMTGSVNVNEPTKTTESEQQIHVVPTGGKKHKIQVEELSHKIVPQRKSMIELIFQFLKLKTRSLGPK